MDVGAHQSGGGEGGDRRLAHGEHVRTWADMLEERDEIVDIVVEVEAALAGPRQYHGLQVNDPWIGDVRFKGLLGGVELVSDRDSKDILDKKLVVGVKDSMHDDGILLTVSGLYGNVLRLQPPLTVTRKHIDACVAAIRRGLDKARQSS